MHIKRKFSLTYFYFFLCIAVIASGCKKDPDEEAVVGDYIKSTIQYKSIPGVSANLLSLDIYSYGDNSSQKPVVIYVHGGGWSIGDKSNKLENKISLFNSLNYVFISINYRLSPNPYEISNANRIKYPDHSNDVADAVKWVYDNISSYGGDRGKIVLMGHSAGAHLASLTGTSQEFLPLRGLAVNMLKGVASIDTEGYDVTSQSGEELYQNAFGTNYNIQVKASPIFNVVASINYPRFFIAKRGTASRIALADAFINKLTSAGVNVVTVSGSQYDHEGINDAIGKVGETTITEPLKIFLQQCFL